MKTVAFTGPGTMELRDVPEPEPADGEAIVAVSFCGICGSDLHEYSSTAPSPRAAGAFTQVMGHEFTGVVASVGPDVDSLSPGDAVVVHPGGACGACYYCQNDLANLCATQAGTGYLRQGAYAERVAVRAGQVIRLPNDANLEALALTEPFGVALRAVSRGDLKDGESILIAGGGPIGLLSTIAAARRGTGTIIVSEPAANRRELALSLGAHHAIDPAQSTPAQVRRITDGLGADVAIEAVGIAPTMDDCINSVRRGGRIVIAGSFFEPYSMNLLSLIMQEQSIIGTFGYVGEFQEAMQLITSGDVDVTPLISRTVPLDNLPTVFEEITNDRSRDHKVLVRPN
jgi:(R,R)-butanediol dehydrogenase/meso-butanediol dehydrogenase/diacetyl reductase